MRPPPLRQSRAGIPLARRVRIRVGILLRLELEPSEAEGGGLDGDDENGEVQGGAALLAEGAPVGLLRHRHVLPPASPRQEGVDLLGRVDGIEEDDGDEGGDQADKGGDEGCRRVGYRLAPELMEGAIAVSLPSRDRPDIRRRLTDWTLLKHRAAMFVTMMMALPTTSETVGRMLNSAGHSENRKSPGRRVWS